MLGVEAVHAGDDHAVHRLLGDDLLELVRSSQPRPGESLVPALVVLATGGVHVDQGDQLGDVGVGAGDRVEEHLAAVAGADDGIAGGHVSPEWVRRAGTRTSSGGDYLMPVVAKPLTRKRWPNRNTRNSGIRETTDMANIAPQSEEPWVSRKDFSASGTVKLSGVVR